MSGPFPENPETDFPVVPLPDVEKLKKQLFIARKALLYCAYPEHLHPANQATFMKARMAIDEINELDGE